MRISDWSSDVCSSDLRVVLPGCRTQSFAASSAAALASLAASRTASLADCVASVTACPAVSAASLVAAAASVTAASVAAARSEEHTSELQSLMRISYAVFCLTKKKCTNTTQTIGIKHQSM